MKAAAPRPPRRQLLLAALLAAAGCARPPSPAGPPAGLPPPPATSAPRAVQPGPPDARYGPEPAVRLTPLEAAAQEALPAAPGPRPRLSGALVLAARALARRAAAGAPRPLDGAALRDALAEGLSYDPAPAAFLARASPSRLREALSGAALPQGTTHLGVGAVEVGAEVVAVVLAAQRRLRLAPFPRAVAAGEAAVLRGDLLAGLRSPRAFVTLPSGGVREIEGCGAGLRCQVRFEERGRYLVEVEAEGEAGPAVTALLVVAAGGASLEAPPEPPELPEAPGPGQAEAQVAAALSALRARQGLSPLALSPQLSEVARRHSAAMLAAGRVAHVVPGSPGPAERLASAAIPYRRVFENVAAAATPLAAHEAAAESPAHRKNMLEPAARRVGIGLARDRLPTGDARVYLTEILIEPAAADDGPLTLDARVREALWQERARWGLPPLTADDALDELARDAAAELRARDARELPDLAERALGLRRGLAAADAFVATEPREATQSQNLRDRRFRRVGVAVVEGASPHYGAGRLFIAVVYTD
ncbi:MAG TPA: CAP domain-containing protein [Anaeromyxobacter sp.]|nr:CAP domain-containing protein [Anaeromyxobacter sp.]